MAQDDKTSSTTLIPIEQVSTDQPVPIDFPTATLAGATALVVTMAALVTALSKLVAALFALVTELSKLIAALSPLIALFQK